MGRRIPKLRNYFPILIKFWMLAEIFETFQKKLGEKEYNNTLCKHYILLSKL
jgi:hypothetical protein